MNDVRATGVKSFSWVIVKAVNGEWPWARHGMVRTNYATVYVTNWDVRGVSNYLS